ncbi:vacuolar protein sorting targeting protein 26 [Cryptosporidium ubiquitum]|uniref:Vacuolar protein sorting targeting protein 26 n=1 Tax=Cryptosporidium ubiquitum TaxID=857276 RepID=A0A1J4MBY0_9CRYT|nr:vacuolar protein sorting targeting protein 26 [Cryptosporidium ubiquitum]OII71730.1 vacuolar protein sorting targeting protein 26 [Cryptosporidium ubiquitum]
MLSFLSSINACNLELSINQDVGRKSAPLSKNRKGEKGLIFSDGEDISGVAVVVVKPGRKLDHQGIRVEVIGQIDVIYDQSSSYDFFSITKDLEPSGSLFETKQYKWKFNAVDKPYETYYGTNIQLRYFVRLTVLRAYASNIVKEVDFVVQNLNNNIPSSISEKNKIQDGIKMEVGVEGCLHIELEYDKSSYHLKDVVIGKVYFSIVRLKIKYMEIDIIRLETCGSGPNAITETEVLSKFEIMDGAPAKQETIPLRMYLCGCDLTPTYKNLQNKLSVRYFLNLIIVDEEDRRYFKRQEITLWRKKIG